MTARTAEVTHRTEWALFQNRMRWHTTSSLRSTRTEVYEHEDLTKRNAMRTPTRVLHHIVLPQQSRRDSLKHQLHKASACTQQPQITVDVKQEGAIIFHT